MRSGSDMMVQSGGGGGGVGAEHVRCPTQSQYSRVLSGEWNCADSSRQSEE